MACGSGGSAVIGANVRREQRRDDRGTEATRRCELKRERRDGSRINCRHVAPEIQATRNLEHVAAKSHDIGALRRDSTYGIGGHHIDGCAALRLDLCQPPGAARASAPGLRPKAVVITGASSGSASRSRTDSPRRTTIVAVDNDENGLRRLARLLPEHSLTTVACDVTDPKSVRRAAQATVEAVGSIDAILNFAGVIKGGPLVEMDDADLALVMSVNVVGTCLINKHFFPLIKPGPAAKIVNVASEVSKARISTAFNAPYTMSKLAVEAYSDSLRQELSLLRIRSPSPSSRPVHSRRRSPSSRRRSTRQLRKGRCGGAAQGGRRLRALHSAAQPRARASRRRGRAPRALDAAAAPPRRQHEPDDARRLALAAARARLFRAPPVRRGRRLSFVAHGGLLDVCETLGACSPHSAQKPRRARAHSTRWFVLTAGWRCRARRGTPPAPHFIPRGFCWSALRRTPRRGPRRSWRRPRR